MQTLITLSIYISLTFLAGCTGELSTHSPISQDVHYDRSANIQDVSVNRKDVKEINHNNTVEDLSTHDAEDDVNSKEMGPMYTSKTLKIMCLGDSISEGTSSAVTYRSYLYLQLKSAGLNVDFVGVNRGVCGNIDEGEQENWDSDHCSYGSARADEILNGNMPINSCSPAGTGNVHDWAPLIKPDIAILHLGTNDCGSDFSTLQILSSFTGIVDVLRNAVPNVKLVVAQIITSRETRITNCANALNAALPQWAADLSTETSPIILVDQTVGWNTSTHHRDSVHPNAIGAERMADRFFPTVRLFFRN